MPRQPKHFAEWKGERRTIYSLAKQHGQTDTRVMRRLAKGWTLEEALLIPGWQTYRYKVEAPQKDSDSQTPKTAK